MMLFPAGRRRASSCSTVATEFRRPGVWLFLAAGLLGWVPVIVWNAAARLGDVPARLRAGRRGRGAGGGFRWTGPLGFAGDQLAVAVRVLAGGVPGGGVAVPADRRGDAGAAAPVVDFGPDVVPVRRGERGEVRSGELAGGLPTPAGPCWRRRGSAKCSAGRARGWWPCVRWVRRSRAWSCRPRAQFPTLVRPAFAKIVGPPTEHNPFPVRRLDLTARLAGWRELAAAVDELRERVRAETGHEAVIVGTHWTIPGILRFYCAGHPQVYTIGSALGADRSSQYDVWRPNPVCRRARVPRPGVHCRRCRVARRARRVRAGGARGVGGALRRRHPAVRVGRAGRPRLPRLRRVKPRGY